ncbi:MAG: hypothetical protein QNJ38_11770 [Prochloraceae cyanobacterium]|nr:hypothetical protein [Prochloraceae cyanobacterium]
MKNWLRIKIVSAVTMSCFAFTLSALAEFDRRSIAETIVTNKEGDLVEVHGEVMRIEPRQKQYIIADPTGEIAVMVRDLDRKLKLGTEIDVFGKLTVHPSGKIIIDAREVELHQD